MIDYTLTRSIRKTVALYVRNGAPRLRAARLSAKKKGVEYMQKITLGRTGIETTAGGLGCGGFSRLGINKGLDHAAEVVRAAFDHGLTFFDTAVAYGTQPAVGKGLDGVPRDKYVISTKYPYRSPQGYITPEQLEQTLDASLRELRTDYIDVWHIHALTAEDYPWFRETLLPVMLRAREAGKVRAIGATEQFAVDTSHEMFKITLPEDVFDVIMTGYNMLNPSAAKTVLPTAIKNNVAVLCMFAVRRALHDAGQLKTDLQRIIAAGQGGAELTENPAALDFLLDAAETLPEAAYRFCRHTPGITVTLTGTGNTEHLRDNLRSLQLPPLPEDTLHRLDGLFGNVDCVSGQ